MIAELTVATGIAPDVFMDMDDAMLATIIDVLEKRAAKSK